MFAEGEGVGWSVGVPSPEQNAVGGVVQGVPAGSSVTENEPTRFVVATPEYCAT